MNCWTSFSWVSSPVSKPGESWKMNCGLLVKANERRMSWIPRWWTRSRCSRHRYWLQAVTAEVGFICLSNLTVRRDVFYDQAWNAPSCCSVHHKYKARLSCCKLASRALSGRRWLYQWQGYENVCISVEFRRQLRHRPCWHFGSRCQVLISQFSSALNTRPAGCDLFSAQLRSIRRFLFHIYLCIHHCKAGYLL